VYGAQHWVSVINPSDATFETVEPLLAEAYERAVNRYRSLHKEKGRG
jgi:predicted DNA-binding protein (MmcQ/YjbR family)